MVTVVRKWGNSMAVRLPKALAEAVELRQGASVDIEARGGRLVVTPVRKQTYRLADLVRGINSTNRHEAVWTDRRRGREAW